MACSNQQSRNSLDQAQSQARVSADDLDAQDEAQLFLSFIFAGKARFALRSHKTGRRIVFRMNRRRGSLVFGVARAKTRDAPFLTLGCVTGAGFDPAPRATDVLEAKAFRWFWNELRATGQIPDDVDVLPIHPRQKAAKRPPRIPMAAR